MLSARLLTQIAAAIYHPDIVQNFTLTRVQVDRIANGKTNTIATTSMALRGSIQPSSKQNAGYADNQAKGLVNQDDIAIFSLDRIIAYDKDYLADVIDWNGIKYRVYNAEDFGGYWEAHATFIQLSNEIVSVNNRTFKGSILPNNLVVLPEVPLAIVKANVIDLLGNIVQPNAPITIGLNGEITITLATNFMGSYLTIEYTV